MERHKRLQNKRNARSVRQMRRLTARNSGYNDKAAAVSGLIAQIKTGSNDSVVEAINKTGGTKIDVNAFGQEGISMLHQCADYPGNVPITQLLIQKGGNVHCVDTDGHTPLHISAKRGTTEVAKVLMNVGLASVSMVTKNGETSLHIAAAHNAAQVADLLINAQADVNVRDYEYMTPLHLAAEMLSVDCANLLLTKGAKVNSLDMYGKSPLHYATESAVEQKGTTNTKLIALLLEHGANPDLPDYKHLLPVSVCKQDDPAHKKVHALLVEASEKWRSKKSGEAPTK